MEKELSKAERTRQFIIEASAPVFNVKGYAGTSMSDITEATGLTKGSIYGNFENKEEVALAVFDYNYGCVSRAVALQAAKANTYEGKLLAYARVYDSFMRGDTIKGGCPILNTAVEADDTNVPLKEKAAKALNKWKKSITDIISQGIEAGEFKAGIEIEEIALSVIALIEGGIMISKATGNRGNLDLVMNTVKKMIGEIKK